MRLFVRAQGVLLLLLLFAGCGYTFGPSKIPNVSSVHVPVVTTDGFRRNIDYLLTEAIQNEIKSRGAYRLTDEASADTILQGKIVDLSKGVLSETRFDDPREVQLRLEAQISWIDRRSGRVLKQRKFPVSHEMFQQASQVSFAPEVGQSMATAQVEAARRLAAQIVDLTELDW